MLYDTENFKVRLLKLAREIYNDDEFTGITNGLSGAYRKSAEEIRQRLEKMPPFDVAKEIKGRISTTDSSFGRYVFLPSYFMHDLNIAAWDKEQNIFMLFYSMKTGEEVDTEEIDGFLSILKSLSDRTRLQILQRLRKEPSYGKKLAEELKLSTASISRQLEQLRSMNLITEEKSEGFKYFRLNSREIDKLIKSIQEFFQAK